MKRWLYVGGQITRCNKWLSFIPHAKAERLGTLYGLNIQHVFYEYKKFWLNMMLFLFAVRRSLRLKNKLVELWIGRYVLLWFHYKQGSVIFEMWLIHVAHIFCKHDNIV